MQQVRLVISSSKKTPNTLTKFDAKNNFAFAIIFLKLNKCIPLIRHFIVFKHGVIILNRSNNS